MKTSKAIRVSLIWIALALAFNAGIYFYRGPEKALEFLTGYLVELSLSVDNIFVFLIIFKYFHVPANEQGKILWWGVLGAQIMRLIFIVAGIALINAFSWLTYLLGLFLMVTGFKLFSQKDTNVDPEHNVVLKLAKRYCPGLSKFAIVLIVIETTDVIFALDSIPAVLAITKDPFIVYTSNIFAILGLRAMYFALAGVMPLFYYLHHALGFVLLFVGFSMFFEHFLHIPVLIKLGVIAGTLIFFVLLSIKRTRNERKLT